MAQEYDTIRIPTEKAAQARKEKRDTGETWGQYITRCIDNPPEEKAYVSVDDVRDEIEAAVAAAASRDIDGDADADADTDTDVGREASAADSMAAHTVTVDADEIDIDMESLAESLASRLETSGPETVSLDASERRRIAEEVAEVLR